MGILRVLLALLVVFDHTGALRFINLPDGSFAVKVFFIISGFYMTLILTNKYTGKGSYGLFISNRFLRLYPIYWVILSMTFFLSVGSYLIYGNWLRLLSYFIYYKQISFTSLGFLGLTNVFLFGQDLVMFLGVNLGTGKLYFTSNFINTFPPLHDFLLVPQAWTIGVELLFYIIAPFIVRRKLKIIWILISLSILIRCIIYFTLGLHHDPWTYRFFPNELALFLIGTISYHLYKFLIIKPIGKKIHKIIMVIYFVILAIYKYLPELNSMVDINSVIFFILTGLSIPSLFILTKKSNLDSRIGDLSYPIYLVHMLMISIVNLIIREYQINFNKSIAVVILTIFISYILVKYISDPIEKIRHKRVTSRHVSVQN